LNYIETETTGSNKQWENLKHAKETSGKLKQQLRKPWLREKSNNPNGTKKKTQAR